VSLLTVPFLFNAPGVPSADIAWDPAKAPALWDALRHDRALPGQASATPSPSASPTSSGNGLTVPPSAITIRVLNGTGQTGIAHQVAAELVAEGFHATAGNAATRGYANTVVRYGSSRNESSLTVAAAVKPSTRQLDPSLGSVVQLVIGADFGSVVPVTVRPASTTPSATPSPGPSLDVVTADQNVCSA
jgi:hypothetical protein